MAEATKRPSDRNCFVYFEHFYLLPAKENVKKREAHIRGAGTLDLPRETRRELGNS